MSRLSDAKEYKKASEDSVGLVGLTGDVDLITKTNIAIITDTALRCLELLAEIADMTEEIKSERIIIPTLPNFPKDYTPPMTAVYAAPVYPTNYEVSCNLERSEDGSKTDRSYHAD